MRSLFRRQDHRQGLFPRSIRERFHSLRLRIEYPEFRELRGHVSRHRLELRISMFLFFGDGEGHIVLNHVGQISIADFNPFRNQMIRSTRAERLSFSGMIELRADMVVVAICLIEHVLQLIKTHTILVSTYSLKEGVLYTMLDGEKVGSH